MFCVSNNQPVVVRIVPISINPFICWQTDLAQKAVVQATTPPHTTVNTSVIRFTSLLLPAVMAKPHLLYNFFCPLPDTPLCSHNTRQFLSEIHPHWIKAPAAGGDQHIAAVASGCGAPRSGKHKAEEELPNPTKSQCGDMESMDGG